jgi:uncharacterized protein (DUF1684 family)
MISLVPLLITLSLGASTAAGPVHLDAAVRDSLSRSLAASRAEDQEALRTSPTSYLAAVQRVDFGAAHRLVVGRAADCDVRVDDPEMPAHALSVSVEGDSFRVAALDTASFRWRHLAFREAMLGPSGIEYGRWTLRLSHQHFPAIIVTDPKSPRFANAHGLEYFPFDPALRFELALTPNPKPDTVIVLSTRANERRALRVGWFDFLAGGRACRLEAHRLLEPGVDEHSVSVFFRDATSGHESYPIGRYVDPEPLADGRWLLDFNQAYNPACAFSPYYNCPMPSRANLLPVPIRAGEKDSHYAH